MPCGCVGAGTESTKIYQQISSGFGGFIRIIQLTVPPTAHEKSWLNAEATELDAWNYRDER